MACTSRDLALSALALVRRWQEVEATADPGAEARLTEKLADLERRMVEADDEVARAGYERARDAVAGLLEQQRALGRGRERLVARLHQQVATLEALHLSTLHLKSADAQRFSCEVEPLLDQAAGLFVEVDDAARVTDALMQLG